MTKKHNLKTNEIGMTTGGLLVLSLVLLVLSSGAQAREVKWSETPASAILWVYPNSRGLTFHLETYDFRDHSSCPGTFFLPESDPNYSTKAKAILLALEEDFRVEVIYNSDDTDVCWKEVHRFIVHRDDGDLGN
jgi:hypothetical protein